MDYLLNVRFVKILFYSLISISILLPVSVSAKTCFNEAKKAKKEKVFHFVVTFEGLFGYALGAPVKSKIIDRAIKDNIGNYFITHDYSWSSKARAYSCILDWFTVLEDNLHLTLLGHSFGGSYGVMDLLVDLEKAGIHVANVITMDPRNSKNDVNYHQTGERNQYIRPSNVDYFLNYWQQGGALPGYGVNGAQNIQVKNIGHIELPGFEIIYQEFTKMILRAPTYAHN